MPDNNTYKRRFIIVLPIFIALIFIICTYIYLNGNKFLETFNGNPQEILNTPDPKAHEAFNRTKHLFNNNKTPNYTQFKQNYPNADMVIFHDVKKMHNY